MRTRSSSWGGVQFLLLDSSVPAVDEHYGQLEPEQLAWLEQRCAADDPRPLVVALHHNPLSLVVTWLEGIALRNGEALHEVLLLARNRLRCVFYGHIHESVLTLRDGIPYQSGAQQLVPDAHLARAARPPQRAPALARFQSRHAHRARHLCAPLPGAPVSRRRPRHNLPLLLLVILLLVNVAAPAQAQAITLEVEAGFDSLFREHHWFPLRVRVTNAGGDQRGRLVVRPETSGKAFSNTFSTAVELPAGARKSVFLYVTARSFASNVRVEFLTDDNLVLAAQEAPLRHVPAQDTLHVLLSDAASGRVDLAALAPGERQSWRAAWDLASLPPLAAALQSVDTFFFNDIDTGALGTAQRQALADRVLAGAHLIVTGGAGWQATAGRTRRAVAATAFRQPVHSGPGATGRLCG